MKGQILLLIVNAILLAWNVMARRAWQRLMVRTQAMQSDANKTNAETKEMLASLAARIPTRGES